MLAVRSIEREMVAAFTSQVERQARRFARRLQNPLLDTDDCFNFGLEVLHEAIYGYVSAVVPFNCFLARVLRNRFFQAARRQQPLPLPRRHYQLLIAYERTIARLGSRCCFEEIVQHLGLDHHDVQRLREARVQVRSFSTVGEDEHERLSHLPARIEAEETVRLTDVLDRAADLLPIERLLLEEAMLDPPRGWKTSAARRLGVTKGAVTQALQRGYRKLRRVLCTIGHTG